MTDWAISGTYLEACNCEAICPCRRVGGRTGGRSTYGICMGALSWAITEGHAGETDLAGLGVVMAIRYDDDEPGSPWDFHLYVDARGDQRQREALVAIYTGALGGTPTEQFPWVRKASRMIDWRPVPIEISHTPRRGWFRAGSHVTMRVLGTVPGTGTGDVRDPRSSPLRRGALHGAAACRRRAVLVRAAGEVRVPVNVQLRVRIGALALPRAARSMRGRALIPLLVAALLGGVAARAAAADTAGDVRSEIGALTAQVAGQWAGLVTPSGVFRNPFQADAARGHGSFVPPALDYGIHAAGLRTDDARLIGAAERTWPNAVDASRASAFDMLGAAYA